MQSYPVWRGPRGLDGDGASWATLPGKPAAFPPAPHVHAIADVTGLAEALAAAGGSPTWDAVTGKPVAFPPVAHQHPWSDLTGIPATFAPSAHTHAWADITGKPSAYAPAAHAHPIAEVTGLQAALDGKAAGAVTIWTGTQAAYDAIVTKSPTTLYFVTE